MRRRFPWAAGPLLFILLGALLFTGAGCRTTHGLPAADLQAPGWTVQPGQAVWKPSRSRPGLAGELLLATRTNGDLFVQFDKLPFPLATAQITGSEWQIRFGAGKYAWHGRGEPPARFVWFQLPHALAGDPLGAPWTFTRDGDAWRLENRRTGEALEGSLTP